jgi:hypothetical protein
MKGKAQQFMYHGFSSLHSLWGYCCSGVERAYNHNALNGTLPLFFFFFFKFFNWQNFTKKRNSKFKIKMVLEGFNLREKQVKNHKISIFGFSVLIIKTKG